MTCLAHPHTTFAFTARLQSDLPRLLIDRIDLLRDAVRLCQKRYPFRIDAAVVLPDHLHMVWTLPHAGADNRTRWRLIKSAFARHAMSHRGDSHQASVWQDSVHQRQVGDAADFAGCCASAFHAPVFAGLCATPFDWPYSSIHRATAVTT